MDERKPGDERRFGVISKAPNCSMQRSCSVTIIRPCAIPNQLPVYVPRHKRRKLITDRPHRTNDSTVTRKQHSRCDMDGLVGETLLTRGRLTCGEEGKPTTGTRQRNNVRYLQTPSIGETESTRNRTCGILDSVACKMDPVCLLHEGKYFLDRADRGFQEGGAC